MKTRLLVSLIACGNVLLAPLRAQPPVTLKSETREVIVDVVVTDKKGAYIHDLTAKNFRVWEENKEQTIRSFALESATPTSAAARTDYMVLLFDYGGMDAADQLRARQAGARFIDANVGPNRMIAVVTFNAGLQIAQSFTNNAGRLKDAVTGAKGGVVSVNSAASGSSASADLDARERFLALRSVAEKLSAVPGRKTMVLLTGSMISGTDQRGALTDAIEACNRSNVAVYPVDMRETSSVLGAAGDSGPSSGVPRTVAQLTDEIRNKSGGPKGDAGPDVTADPIGASQESLFALASGTGGFVIRNASELLAGLQKIGQEQDEYYLLGYTPSGFEEGTCHPLKVKVDRSGASLRARASYCIGNRTEVATGSATEQNLEKRAAEAQTGSIAASMRLPFFYSGPDVAQVHVAMEIQPQAMKFEKKAGKLHADVSVLGIASSADGGTGSHFSDTLVLDFDEADQSWNQKPVHYEQQFKIAPGQYTFTVVFSAGGESFGKLEQLLVIEPHRSGHLALSALALGKGIRKAGAAPLQSLFDDQRALTVGGIDVIPTGQATFAKTEQAFCYFEVYLPTADGSAPPMAAVRVLNVNSGEVAWDGGAGNVDAPAGNPTVPVGLTVPIASLPSGSYRLEVTVTDGADQTAKRTVDFEIK